MEIEDLDIWLDEARFGEPRPFLVKPLWPSDAYGVLGAQDKAGKTWAAVDLAVSVANGVPWFGRFDVGRRGSVVYYCGEGGKRNLARRFSAVAAAKGLGDYLKDPDADGRTGSWSEQIRVSDAVPPLTKAAALEQVNDDLEAHPGTALVIIDPLYLASAGLKGSDLYEMGTAFGPIQRICDLAGAALVVLTHWNKTGEGDGPGRFTGVGPGAWGRVLGSAKLEKAGKDGHASVVTLKWTFMGSEIPETEFWTRRRVQAEDPDDLDSQLFYAVETFDENPVQEEKAEERATDRLATRLERKRLVYRLIREHGPLSTAKLTTIASEYPGLASAALVGELAREIAEGGYCAVEQGPRGARIYHVPNVPRDVSGTSDVPETS